MKHILELLEREKGGRDKWAIVGKGPSFCKEKIRELKENGYKLCAINNAFDGVEGFEFDLCVFIDWSIVLEFKCIAKCRAYATISKAHTWIDPHYKLLPGLLPTVLKMSKLPNLYGFDALGSEAFPGWPQIFFCVSSTEAAFDILCKAGVKHFAFNGVDGGRGYSKRFTSKTFNDLTGQFRGIAIIAKKYGIEDLAGIPEEMLDRFFRPARPYL